MLGLKVEQWTRFECAIENPAPYPDPFREVSLDLDYVKPDGSSLAFWGFHDGGTTWRFRVMPDQPGTWRYVARFSDGSPGAEGEFTCTPGNLHGPLGPDSANPLWFGFRDGAHTLVRSLHAGDCFFAANLPDGRRTEFLDWCQAQGYNLLSLGSHYLNRDEPGRGRGWETPRLWPPDPSEYSRMEAVLDDLAARSIMVYPFGGFFGRGAAWPRDPADQELYVRYALARLAPCWHVLLNVSGPEPLLQREGRHERVMTKAALDAWGCHINALDPFRHAISVHNRTGDDAWRQDDWPTYSILQGPKTTDPETLSEGLLRNHHPDRPLYAQETLWSGNKNHPDYSDDELRRNAWILMMSGAALCLADNGGPDAGDIGDSSTGFSGTLELSDRRQWRHDIAKEVWDLFSKFPFWRMAPRQELVSGGYCLAEPGILYLVYLDQGGPVDVRVEPGEYAVEWINARDAVDRRMASPTRDGLGLRAPDGNEWLLHLASSRESEPPARSRQMR
jgi:hypothetical protein